MGIFLGFFYQQCTHSSCGVSLTAMAHSCPLLQRIVFIQNLTVLRVKRLSPLPQVGPTRWCYWWFFILCVIRLRLEFWGHIRASFLASSPVQAGISHFLPPVNPPSVNHVHPNPYLRLYCWGTWSKPPSYMVLWSQ